MNQSVFVSSFLLELRLRLIRYLVCLIGLFAIFSYEASALYQKLASPLLRYLPSGHLIATNITAPFSIPFKLAFLCALLLSMPVFLYQAWAFVSPALYGRERRFIWPAMITSLLLFYAGVGFSYGVILPLLFKFLAGITPGGVMFMPDMSDYLDFTTQLLLVFGVLFEIPMIMIVLARVGLVTYARLKAWRGYAIVASFILGMLFAPPDVLSQTLLALPVWGLYELGLILIYWGNNAEKK